MIYPGIQIERAWRLASAFGHEWAGVLTDDDGAMRSPPVPAWGWTQSLIAALAVASRNPDPAWWTPGGILSPSGSRAGVIEHETLTGRLRWVIDDDGHTVITVARPAGDVLCALVWPNGVVDVRVTTFDEPYHARHVAALDEAVRALVPAWEMPPAIVEGSLPDEPVAEEMTP